MEASVSNKTLICPVLKALKPSTICIDFNYTSISYIGHFSRQTPSYNWGSTVLINLVQTVSKSYITQLIVEVLTKIFNKWAFTS